MLLSCIIFCIHIRITSNWKQKKIQINTPDKVQSNALIDNTKQQHNTKYNKNKYYGLKEITHARTCMHTNTKLHRQKNQTTDQLLYKVTYIITEWHPHTAKSKPLQTCNPIPPVTSCSTLLACFALLLSCLRFSIVVETLGAISIHGEFDYYYQSAH